MKHLFTLLVTLFLISNLFAQAPQKMSYQAVLRNSSNQLIANTQVGMRISILQGTIAGTVVYSEVQNPSTNDNGLISLQFGGGTGFDTINWGNGPYFLKSETDPAGGSNYSISGTTQLLSVPYALYASNLNISKGNVIYSPYVMFDGNMVALPRIDVESPYNKTPTVTDVDGNMYGTVKIGTQVWLNENLKSTKFNDGTNIPMVNDSATWVTTTSPAFCWYNDSLSYKNLAGGLYNSYTVQTGKLCPTGWHVPSNSEWSVLTSYLGEYACIRLTQNGIYKWADALNDSKFNGLAGYSRNKYGFNSPSPNGDLYYQYLGLWSSSLKDNLINILEINSEIGGWPHRFTVRINSYYNYPYGISVRCLKD